MSSYSESDLSGMSRKALDRVLLDLGLDPTDYDTKSEAIEAIQEEQNQQAQPTQTPTSEQQQSEGALTAEAEQKGQELEVKGAADIAIDEIAPFAGVDVKMIPAAMLPGEHVLLTPEAWVVLGANAAVPPQQVGSPAYVVSSSISRVIDNQNQIQYEYTDPNATILVRPSLYGGWLSVPLSSCTKVNVNGGRVAILPVS